MLCHFVLLPKALADNGLLMNPPNKACSGRVGRFACRIYKHFSGFEFFLHLKQCPHPPTCQYANR